MQATFGRQTGVMVPDVPCVDSGNWGRELALCECSVLQIIFDKNRALYVDVCFVHESTCVIVNKVSLVC